MTGFGAGAAESAAGRVGVEIRTVNGRFAEAGVRTPYELSSLEARVRDTVVREIRRGRATVSVEWKPADATAAPGLRLNEDAVAALVREWSRLMDTLPLPPLTADAILGAPGVITSSSSAAPGSPDQPAEEIERLLDEALAGALAKLNEARAAEGERLVADLRERGATLAMHLDRIAALAPESVEAGRERLRKRWAELSEGAGVAVDAARLEFEMASLADRADITEELVRLRSHLKALDTLLNPAEPDPAGRPLDFLLQELGREVNTIGSKGRDTSITTHVLALKNELERIREQAANVL